MLSPIAVDAVLFAAALALILRGADWFVGEALGLAARTGIPRAVVGATIVSMATTLPEFAISAIAAATGSPGIAYGNAVGSCIVNIGLVLGALVLARPALDPEGGLKARLLLMLGAGVITAVVSLDGLVGRVEALALVGVLGLYLVQAIRDARRALGRSPGSSPGTLPESSVGHSPAPSPGQSPEPAAAAQDSDPPLQARNFLRFAAGAALVIVGSRLLVSSGTSLARAAGVSELVIGLTLVSVGTSMPELVTAVASFFKRAPDVSLGNIVGANILNLSWVLGTAALIRPIRVADPRLPVNLVTLVGMMGALTLFYLTGRRLLRWEGALLVGTYGAYLWRVLLAA